jgi:hypothetical protein
MLAFTVGTAAAQPDVTPTEDAIWDGSTEPFLSNDTNAVFYPWVANDDESAGLGSADTSVTVQNLTNRDAYAWAFVGVGDDALPGSNGWDLVGPFYLSRWASKTFSAADLGIEAGDGAPVTIVAYHELYTEGAVCPVDGDINGNGTCTDVEAEILLFEDDFDFDPVLVCVVVTSGGEAAPYWNPILGEYVVWESVEDLEAAYFEYGPDAFDGLGIGNVLCTGAEPGEGGELIALPATIGGVAKQAVDGENLPMTTTADTAVSGYNAISGLEIYEFDEWYLPIAQTNCGPGGCWNTIIRAANFGQIVGGEVGNIGAAAVTARFFPADDGSGSLQTGFQLEALVNSGDTWSIDLSDWVPEGWVGSVHFYSDSNIFVMADRVKVGYNMWLTNTGTNAYHTNIFNVPGGLGQYVLFAPDVRLDFFGWNTGINVANLENADNNVNIQYFNLYGNASQGLSQRLAPQGMTYFYDPAQAPQDNSQQDPGTDLNADIIGSALIWSDYPVSVAVDATKYPESTTDADLNVFQGMTYNATANVYNWQALPLVQKGNPADGMGATSGVNIMNPNAVATQAVVYWVNQSGFSADNFGQSAVAVPAFANGFVYTMAAHNLPNGFYGAALVYATYPVAVTTANVDYQVQYDGSVIWNAVNPCGFYRDAGFGCNFGDPFEQPEGGSVEKIITDEFGEPVAGVGATLYNTVAWYELNGYDLPGVPWIGYGFSDATGEITWTNVPEGDYVLVITNVPGDFDVYEWDIDGDGIVEIFGPDFDLADFNVFDTYFFSGYGEQFSVPYDAAFTLFTGEDIVIENLEIPYVGATKLVWTGVAGLNVCLHVAEDPTIIIDCEVSDESGDVIWTGIPEGEYIVSVNGEWGEGVDAAPVNPLYESPILGPAEFFGWGELIINEFTFDAIGPGTLIKNFDIGLAPNDTPWDNVESTVTIYDEDFNLVEEVGVSEFFSIDEQNFFIETVLPAGEYQLCYYIELTEDISEDLNEVQSFNLGGAAAPLVGSYDITIPAGAPGGGGTTAVIAALADEATVQAAIDAAIGAGEVDVTVETDIDGNTILTFEFIGVNAGVDIVGLVVIGDPLIGFNGNTGDATVLQEGGLFEDTLTVVWTNDFGFGFCDESFIIEEDQTTELFNDIEFDGFVTGSLVIELTGTTVGETYEVCLLAADLFDATLGCIDGVAGADGSVLVTFTADDIDLFFFFGQFGLPEGEYRARVRDEDDDTITLSDPTFYAPGDLPPNITVVAPVNVL